MSSNEMEDSSGESDSDGDIEAMLYSQIHHEWVSHDDESKNTHVNGTHAPIGRASVLNCKSAVTGNDWSDFEASDGDDVIVLSSDDTECEILDCCDIVSKYNYCGSEETIARVRNSRPTKPKAATTSTQANVTEATSTSCLASLYIHIDGDQAQMEKEEIEIGADSDIVSVSSSDDEKDVSRSEKRKAKVAVSPAKKKRRIAASKNCIVDEDFIVEIPVPVRRGDDWFVNDGDRCKRTPNRRSDFHRRKLYIICNNCSRRGHISKVCPEPVKKINCYICGETGHLGGQCWKSACSLCRETGHTYYNCQQKRKAPYLKCSVCQVPGHLVEHCPDFWRRYHLTIEHGKPVAGKPLFKSKDASFCCNCGHQGHFVHECQEKRMDFFVLPNRLDVANYNGLLPTPSSQGAPQKFSFAKCKKQWRKKFRCETRMAKSFASQKFRKQFKFGNNVAANYKRNNNAQNGMQYDPNSIQAAHFTPSPNKKNRKRKGNFNQFRFLKWGNFKNGLGQINN